MNDESELSEMRVLAMQCFVAALALTVSAVAMGGVLLLMNPFGA